MKRYLLSITCTLLLCVFVAGNVSLYGQNETWRDITLADNTDQITDKLSTAGGTWSDLYKIGKGAVEGLFALADMHIADIENILNGNGVDWFEDIQDREIRNRIRSLISSLYVMQRVALALEEATEIYNSTNEALQERYTERLGNLQDQIGSTLDLVTESRQNLSANIESASLAAGAIDQSVQTYRNLIEMQNDALERTRPRMAVPALTMSLLPGYSFSQQDPARAIITPGLMLQAHFNGWGLGIGAITPGSWDSSLVFLSLSIPLVNAPGGDDSDSDNHRRAADESESNAETRD